MTDLAAMLATRHPGDDVDLIIADWLDDRGGDAECPKCGSTRYVLEPDARHGMTVGADCPLCLRTGVLRAVDFRLAHAMRRVCASPDDDTPRLDYATVLEDYAGTVVCETCRGAGHFYHDPPFSFTTHCCPAMCDEGRVSDGRRERAEFIRCQVEIAKSPAAFVSNVHPLRRRERELLKPNWHWFELGEFECISQYFEATSDNHQLPEIVLGTRVPGPTRRTIRAYPNRGFIDRLTLTAADWLRVADRIYWHPEQTVACPNSSYYAPRGPCCPVCGAGYKNTSHNSRPRPFVPTAHPIRRVVLTTWSELVEGYSEERSGWRQLPDGTYTHSRWPDIIFTLPE